MSPDTIVPTSTQGTQAWDRYAFVNNNPVRYTDPTGHKLEENKDDAVKCTDPSATNNGQLGSCKYSPAPVSQTAAGTVEDENSLPLTIVLHPLDGNVVSTIPVYAYYNGHPVIIGYTETFYGFDYSTTNFNLGASGTIPWLIPVGYEVVKWGAAKASISFACPVCEGVMWSWTIVNGINDSVTLEGHLQERFYYAVRHDFYSSDYNPFVPTYDPHPFWSNK